MSKDEETWDFDTNDEFFAEYRRGFSLASLQASFAGGHEFSFVAQGTDEVKVALSAATRAALESTMAIFDAAEPGCRVPRVPSPEANLKPVVFIGHGQNGLWRELKDHLQDHHGLQLTAYEIGARAGHTIRDILEGMLDSASFALAVMTAEDEQGDGALRARQNVVHELGLFQGRLGFSRAIALVEEDCDTFSNLSGIQQIRFSEGNIRETYGDVLATIRREFEDAL